MADTKLSATWAPYHELSPDNEPETYPDTVVDGLPAAVQPVFDEWASLHRQRKAGGTPIDREREEALKNVLVDWLEKLAKEDTLLSPHTWRYVVSKIVFGEQYDHLTDDQKRIIDAIEDLREKPIKGDGKERSFYDMLRTQNAHLKAHLIPDKETRKLLIGLNLLGSSGQKGLIVHASREAHEHRMPHITEIGRGGQGSVHLAMAGTKGKVVKLLYEHDAGDENGAMDDTVQKASPEADAVASETEAGPRFIPHPSRHVLVNEFIPGSVSLDKPEAVVTDWGKTSLDLAKRLLRLHAENHVHRDIKPSNILLCPDGTTRIIDYGIAREAAPGVRVKTNNTLEGTMIFLPPEGWGVGQDDTEFSDKTDIYAMGATLYEVITGKPWWQRLFEVTGRDSKAFSIKEMTLAHKAMFANPSLLDEALRPTLPLPSAPDPHEEGETVDLERTTAATPRAKRARELEDKQPNVKKGGALTLEQSVVLRHLLHPDVELRANAEEAVTLLESYNASGTAPAAERVTSA